MSTTRTTTLDLSRNLQYMAEFQDMRALAIAEAYSLDAPEWITRGCTRASRTPHNPHPVAPSLPREVMYSGT